MRSALLSLLACALAVTALAHGSHDDGHRRVATLVPMAREALAKYADKVEVVASVRNDMRTPLPAGITDLGSPHGPNFELLTAARPNLVVVDAQMHAQMRESLERSGADVLTIDSTSIDSTFRGLSDLGAAVGVKNELEADVADARAQLAAQRLAKPEPTLALFGAPGSFFVVTERTWLGDLMRQIGLTNVAPTGLESGRFPGFAPLNDEVLATLSPELVLLVAHGNPRAVQEAFERELAERPVWKSVRESAARGVHALDPALFSSNPGLDLPRAAKALRAIADTPPKP
jgi:iron complex transport system substrate-binding protein